MKTLTNLTNRVVQVPYRFDRANVSIVVPGGRRRIVREVVKHKDLRRNESVSVDDRIAKHSDAVRLMNTDKISIKG